MAGDEEPTRRAPGGPGARLWRVRWLLAAACAAALVFALAEPHRLGLVAGGLLLVFVAAAFIPLEMATPSSPPVRSARRPVWPDGSMKSLADALPFPAYLLDSAGVLRHANSHAEPVFGRPVIGDPISITFRQPEIGRIVSQAVASGRPSAGKHADHIPGDRSFDLRVVPVPRPGGGAPDFFLMFFLDETEARRAEQMRSDFIANASHELRTPLASLRGFIETIRGPAANDPAAIARFLDIMLDQAERMSRLIDDLLSLSRIEMKAHLRPAGRVALDDVMGNVAGALRPLAEKLGVTISLSLPGEPVVIAGDRDELIQVFQNLVENACKYGQSGGKVEISATLLDPARDGAPRRVEVAVRDHGPGIAAEHLPRLTERFYRVDVGTSREKQGTGLGLAIVKHILNRHGTRLSVTSVPGDGARFSVAFPLAPDSAPVEKGE